MGKLTSRKDGRFLIKKGNQEIINLTEDYELSCRPQDDYYIVYYTYNKHDDIVDVDQVFQLVNDTPVEYEESRIKRLDVRIEKAVRRIEQLGREYDGIYGDDVIVDPPDDGV